MTPNDLDEIHVNPDLFSQTGERDTKKSAEPKVSLTQEETGIFCGFQPLRALIGCIIGAAIAALLLTVGVWKTLFVLVFCAAGAFLFGIGEKQQSLKNLVNRLFPPRN